MRLFGGDRRRNGTRYRDRMNRILGVCQSCGVLWRDEKAVYHGQTETYRRQLVRAGAEVVLTPQYEKYPLTVNPAVLARIRGMAPQFAYALNVAAVSVEVDGDTIYIRVPRDGAAAGGVVSFETAWALAPDLAGALLCGMADNGDQAALDLRDPAHVHAAAVGMTGSGKTTLLQTLLLSAEMQGLPVALFDPLGRRGGLWPLSGHYAVWGGGMFAEPATIERALQILARTDQGADVYAFVDETPSLCRARPGIASALEDLAQVGRHSGVHLILGSQSATGIPALQNIAARLVGKVADRQAAYFATGREASGAETLRGRGDFVFCCGDVLARFQAAQPGADLLKEWAEQYRPGLGELPRAPAPAKQIPAPVFVRAQSTAPIAQVATVTAEPSPGGEPGRPQEEPSRRVVCWAASEWKENGRPPTLTALYGLTRRWYRHGYGRPRARRTLEAARLLLEGHDGSK